MDLPLFRTILHLAPVLETATGDRTEERLRRELRDLALTEARFADAWSFAHVLAALGLSASLSPSEVLDAVGGAAGRQRRPLPHVSDDVPLGVRAGPLAALP